MEAAPSKWTVPELYERHGDFVYKVLARFGVPDRDLPDQLQEVFIVVHRQLPRFRHEADMTTWLFSIGRRVAAAYRRRSYRVREDISPEPQAQVMAEDCPETNATLSQARAKMETILSRMSLDQRAVFVMFEIDGMTGQEIASLMACPLQTVFSRLRRGRAIFEQQIDRMRSVEQRMAG